jgi:hypothetical protein
VDTLRLLFEVDRVPERGVGDLLPGWKLDSHPHYSLVACEGNPGDGSLWSPADVLEAGAAAESAIDASFGVRANRGVPRADFTTSRAFRESNRGRAFLAGMAVLEFPRLEATRRGTPVHSVWWTGVKSAAIKNRVYDESFKVPGREAFARVRLEDQRRFPAGARPGLDDVADPEFQRERFRRRFEPMRKAVDGVKAATFPVVAQALADEARYGFRSVREAERLAGSLVLLSGGAGDSYARATLYRRRAELREAGFAVVDDFLEPVEVDLGDELESALEEFGS